MLTVCRRLIQNPYYGVQRQLIVIIIIIVIVIIIISISIITIINSIDDNYY
jgi:flagellar basal body-associated protein FliL